MKAGSRESLNEDRSLLRWGGLAGMLGALVFIFVPMVLFGLVPSTPPGSFRIEGGAQVDPGALVSMFPASRAPIALGNLLSFVSYVLSLALVLALYRALRGARPFSALMGTALYLFGLAVLFTETVTQVAFDPISALYHAPGATTAQQATLILLWQATQGMFYELDAASGLLLTAAIFALGAAAYRAPAFGKAVGALSMLLGSAGFAAMWVFGITSFIVALLLIPIFVIVPLVLGWKVYVFSNAVASGMS